MAKRDCTKLLLLSQDEIDRIHAKMEEAGIRNMSAYLRKMALDGICVKLELDAGFELQKMKGIDAESELVTAMSNEIKFEIDW